MFPTLMFTITGPHIAALTCDVTQLLCSSGTLRTSKVLSHDCFLGSCLSSSPSFSPPFHHAINVQSLKIQYSSIACSLHPLCLFVQTSPPYIVYKET
ncbi:hypothetical protein E2C01_076038 [Portunus trituberculatus]|uniref:Uncharacterized protein n=1 Tax=Portunus trituberculatus TaxID=210409 RepID=A0A5B7IC75_PORTR|nr:hypothetical protein [Portunus trituberculatus]